MPARKAASLAAPALLCGIAAAVRLQVSLTRESEDTKIESRSAVDPNEVQQVIDPYRNQVASFVGDLLKARRGDDYRFDEQFFRDTCDLSEHTSAGFDRDENKVSSLPATDGTRWIENKKCENADIGFPTVMKREGFTGTSHDCANLCAAESAQMPGHAICCMHHRTEMVCQAEVGWQAQQASSYKKFWQWWRKAKLARLIYQPATAGDPSATDTAGQVSEAESDQEIVGKLLTEVNHMSIDGVLDHLLSFYICMRWVPDHEFVDLAKFELTQVSMDERTPAVEQVSHDDVIQMFLVAGLTPLRCTSQVSVKNMAKINGYLQAFSNTSSPLSQLYTSVKTVHEAGESVFNRIANTNAAMHYDASRGADSVFIEDMRAVARRPDILPWPTFLRSSNYYTHHDSSPENLFMICFGPRIASFPHKRANGKYVLADQNMAGCNGFWDIETMAANMNRIKKLFAPELCFEYSLRKELRNQFLRTFVSMNEEFDSAMANRYSKKVHSLDPTQGNFDIDALGIEDPEAQGDSYTLKKYQRLAGLVSKAHAKWIICPTKPGVNGSFGNEDNVFRDPAAYEKWIGSLVDETIPECRTMEGTTGCAKCIIAVKDVHNCHARMNVTLASLLGAIKERKFPYYASRYTWADRVGEGGNRRWQVVEKTGVCLVRKSGRTAGLAADSGDVQDLRDAFFNLNDTDEVVSLVTDADPGPGGRVEADYLYSVGTRREYYHDRSKEVPADDLARLLALLHNDRFSDPESDWAAKFVFTDDIAERDNRPAFKVDYFVSCPCSAADHAPQAHFDQFGSQGLAEYWNR